MSNNFIIPAIASINNEEKVKLLYKEVQPDKLSHNPINIFTEEKEVQLSL